VIDPTGRTFAMSTPTVDLPVVHATTEPAIATLVLAFTEDPVIRWILPDPQTFLTAFPRLAALLGGSAFDAGTADRTDGDSGAALWVPPSAPSDDEALVALLVHSVAEHRHPEAFAFLEQVETHHPAEPHWYLPFIGVDPAHQGKGVGSALLQRGLARADADRLPAYLEASSPRNRALYERHGFVVIGEIQTGDSPPLWPMWRPVQE
jgi:ribosomal protein S18 acetylase RimI-like enzyme